MIIFISCMKRIRIRLSDAPHRSLTLCPFLFHLCCLIPYTFAERILHSHCGVYNASSRFHIRTMVG